MVVKSILHDYTKWYQKTAGGLEIDLLSTNSASVMTMK